MVRTAVPEAEAEAEAPALVEAAAAAALRADSARDNAGE
jgi:hypothetical protein